MSLTSSLPSETKTKSQPKLDYYIVQIEKWYYIYLTTHPSSCFSLYFYQCSLPFMCSYDCLFLFLYFNYNNVVPIFLIFTWICSITQPFFQYSIYFVPPGPFTGLPFPPLCPRPLYLYLPENCIFFFFLQASSQDWRITKGLRNVKQRDLRMLGD